MRPIDEHHFTASNPIHRGGDPGSLIGFGYVRSSSTVARLDNATEHPCQFCKNYLGDRNEFSETMQGSDELFGGSVTHRTVGIFTPICSLSIGKIT